MHKQTQLLLLLRQQLPHPRVGHVCAAGMRVGGVAGGALVLTGMVLCSFVDAVVAGGKAQEKQRRSVMRMTVAAATLLPPPPPRRKSRMRRKGKLTFSKSVRARGVAASVRAVV
eukprot:3396046-Pleurochrysis_carterae.AAC.1